MDDRKLDLRAEVRERLARLDGELSAIWNLGDNVLLAWARAGDELLFLAVRHYAIPESVHGGDGAPSTKKEALRFINDLVSGPKQLRPDELERACRAFDCEPTRIRAELPHDDERVALLVSEMVRVYGVTLVRDRAVILLDAVQFSLQPPLDQMSMLNSLAYSVNSAHAQLLSKNIRIEFARTTTGDGFYIWNRARTADSNTELYKLLMMLLADNAVARSKARSSWVPKLRAAFHVGDHYEFHQVEGLNPTNFSYIVGQVTVDLARMVQRALPGQILLGDFQTSMGDDPGAPLRRDTIEFVEETAATLDQLAGLEISGGRISSIRCYLTGRRLESGGHFIHRYHLRDKHGSTRQVYNAKINIHREGTDPIYLGIQNEDLANFDAELEALRRNPVAGALTP